MVRRRIFGWMGELIPGGGGPTGVGDSAYNPVVVGTGDYIHARGDLDLNWRVVHPQANSGLGIFAWIWNHHGPIRPTLGTSPQYPNPSLDWYDGFHVGTNWNSFTEGRAGGLWPSELFGSDHSFLLKAHGDPGNVVGDSPPESLDASFSFKTMNGGGRLIPKDVDILGQITAIQTVSGATVELTLSRAHGITISATRDVWIFGLGRSATGPADPNLRGKFSAVASATNKIQITLAATWTGQTGRLPGGIVFAPSHRITALSNPRDNLVRVALTAAFTDVALGAASLRPGVQQVYVSDITGTGTNPNGRKVYVERTVSWRPLLRTDIAVAAAAAAAATAKTITRSSGTWSATPTAGDVVRVTGSLHSDGLHRLASATSSVLTLDSTYRLFRDETIASCRVELLSRSVTFAAAGKTLTVGSGTWDATPTAGQKVVVQGSASNNQTFTVVSATSTVITVSETVVNETSSCEVYLANEIEWDENAPVTITGWNSDGWVSGYALWGAAFVSAAAGQMPIGEATSILTSLDAAARAAFHSDTLSPEMLSLSLGYNDVNATVGSIEQTILLTSYGDALEETITAIREQAAAASSAAVTANEIPFVMVQFGPSPELSASSPTTKNEAGHLLTHVLSIRSQTNAAVARLELCTLVDTEDLPHQIGGINLTADSEIDLGYRMWDALQRLRAGTTTPTTRRGVPFYVLLGQSQTVGVQNAAFTLDADPDFDGKFYDGAGIDFSGGAYDGPPIHRPRLMWMWDPLEETFQELAAQKNANRYSATVLSAHGGGAAGTPTGGITLGPGIGQAGPEQSFVLSLRKRHPEGVFVYKLALGGAALGPVPGLPTFDPATEDLSAALRADFSKILAWFHARGLVPDTRGIAFDQGEGDLFETWHEQYAQNLDAFIAYCRDLFSTSSSSRAEVPFVIGRVQSHDRMSEVWASRVATVQAAQDGAKTRNSNVGVASMQGLPIGSDNVHRTYRAAIEAGYRLADAFAQTTHADDGQELDNGAQLNPEMQAGTAEDGSPEFDPTGETISEVASPGAGGAGATSSPSLAEQVAATSPAEMLAFTEGAIAAFLADGGLQSYSVDGFAVSRANLSDLMRLRATLRVEADSARGGLVLVARRGRY